MCALRHCSFLHPHCNISKEALIVQRYWRGGILWCCESSHSALALEEQENSREAMG